MTITDMILWGIGILIALLVAACCFGWAIQTDDVEHYDDKDY